MFGLIPDVFGSTLSGDFSPLKSFSAKHFLFNPHLVNRTLSPLLLRLFQKAAFIITSSVLAVVGVSVWMIVLPRGT